ncbi:MAG: S-methyl-5-thioribose-1-phosphate isomerase [Deltaproteobacteria bacterium]|jgi:methylthioribose-1-phosphate isomerase|nr:S-methyl-5-thioribose-1-phosphate isomerase [Deltaproteobacteria bacterium]MBW2535634.1 S-methyl-5-thioribose-1-phosphate isomerase [Deltaproteobacteria bacterium]
MTALSGAEYSAAELAGDGRRLFVLDQRRLPLEERYVTVETAEGAAETIRDMLVRGAPAIGITAAYGMALAAGRARDADPREYLAAMGAAGELLRAARPTAVNLGWAVERSLALAEANAGETGARRWHAQAELGRQIHREDVAACRAMGRVGAARLGEDVTVLTHCNTGALATGGYGTALGVIRAAVEAGKTVRVLADETRPYLQGARLTAWELGKDGIDVTVITDSMAAYCMREVGVDAVVVGADRIAANGDVANKIGTYGLACLAEAHGVPFYVAAPWSTVDLKTPDGGAIVIEERGAREITHIGDHQLVADGVAVIHPAFDVTPARLITAIFTEGGDFPPGELGRHKPRD